MQPFMARRSGADPPGAAGGPATAGANELDGDVVVDGGGPCTGAEAQPETATLAARMPAAKASRTSAKADIVVRRPDPWQRETEFARSRSDRVLAGTALASANHRDRQRSIRN